jgi:hypothetical protein
LGLFDRLKWWRRDRDTDYDGFIPQYTYVEGVKPLFNQYASLTEKLEVIFSNPAALFIFKLSCDLYSLGKFKCYKTFVGKGEEKELPKDAVLKLLNNPNPYQTGRQLLWDQMFWNMVGVSYTYVNSTIVDNSNKIYVLMNNKLDFPQSLIDTCDKLVLSSATEEQIFKTVIKYQYDDGSSILIPLGNLVINTNLSNGTGNFFSGNSCIDALYKVMCNAEASLDSQNINIRYAGKFMVAGQADPNNVTQLGMGETEKLSIEQKMNGRKAVLAVKSMIDIKRFVENYAQLELNKAWLDSAYIIAKMYNIPRDVVELYASSTYENQEKARASMVSYCLQPAGDDFAMSLTQQFGYDRMNKEVVITWEHLPFVQVFESEKAKVNDTKAQTFLDLINNGVSIDEANAFTGTAFTTGTQIQRNKPNTVTANG